MQKRKVRPLKLWLLDADVIIDLLALGIFGKLVKVAEIHTSSIVVSEVKFFNRSGQRIQVDFYKQYVELGYVTADSASAEEIGQMLSGLPVMRQEVLDAGELECLAILRREEEIVFCTCDAVAIRALPFLGLSERGASLEAVLKTSGFSSSQLKDRHTEAYFRDNLSIGQRERVLAFGQPEKRTKGKG